MRQPTEAELAAALQWDSNADAWARNLAGQLDVINESFGIPSFLAFLGDLHGRKLLDAGCGEGRSSRHLARLGAQVTGVDISPLMIEHARRHEAASPLGIDYRVAPCADLHHFADRSFDLVTSVMAMMDSPDLAGSLREFSRVLKPGGELAIMVRHPCFFTPGYTLLPNRSGLAVAGYFRGKPYLERWRFPAAGPATAEPFAVTRHPHTLADYLNNLLENGFALSGVSEPRPSEEVCQRIPNLRFWQRHAALYLFLRATKNVSPPPLPV